MGVGGYLQSACRKSIKEARKVCEAAGCDFLTSNNQRNRSQHRGASGQTTGHVDSWPSVTLSPATTVH